MPKGFDYTEKGSMEAKDAWRNLFGNAHIGSVADLTDETLSYIAGVFHFCIFKLEATLLAKGLMVEGESMDDALARFTPEQQAVMARFINPDVDWTRFDK